MGWRSRPVVSVHRFGQREAEVKDMARNSQWVCISLLPFLFGVTGAQIINGTDCTGHATFVNAAVQKVECSPAVNTVQFPVVEATWELEIADTKVTAVGCYKIVLYRNQSVAYYESIQRTVHQRISTKLLVNTSTSVTECNNIFKATVNTTRFSTCCLSQFHQFLAVDKGRGSLILHIPLQVNTAEDLLHGTPATCSLTGSNGQTANDSFRITTQNKKEYTQPQYSKARPPLLSADSVRLERSEVKWHVGSSSILCVVVIGARDTRSQWSYNGLDLSTTEVSIATEKCVDCRQEECIREAERKAGLNSTHPPMAIVGKWETPCFGVAPLTISWMSFVRVGSAALGDSGNYVVNYFERHGTRDFSHSYNVTVDYLRETSFVEEPSGELVVHEGQALQVPCVINTAVDTNLSQVYWSTGSNIQRVISKVLHLSEEDAALNYSSKQTCARYLPNYGRMFYTAHHRHVHDDSGAVMREASLRLYLCNVQEEDSGVFQCWHPDISRRMILRVQTDKTPQLVVAVLLSGLASVLLAVLIIISAGAGECTRRAIRKRPHKDIPVDFGPDFSQLPGFIFMQMAASGFREEADPEVESWEFPRENLRPLEVLGQGNFGKVLKARAVGILPDRPDLNVVAVKVVKGDQPQSSAVDELWAELQLMKSLKPHPNIVNLLGQCTFPDGPLCIIMELASMGSLKDFLKECCKLLQLDKQQRRGKMIFAQHCPPAQQPISNYLCGGGTWRSDAQASHEAQQERGDPFRTYANLYMNVPSGSSVMRSDSGCGCSERECTAYRTSLSPLRRATGAASPSYGYLGDYVGGRHFTASSSGYCGSDHMQSLSEDAAYWSQEGKLRSIVSSRFSSDFSGYVGAVKGKNNAARETSHYVTYAGLLKDVDLFNIGAQVARGMEHLRKMKCVHRDLAARNVLIADSFILKVADFGLARDTEEKTYYRRMTNRPLPARWMALESLVEGTHTSKTDVWAYGVLLWEVLTYGKVPYIGVPAATSFQGLTEYLQAGERLEKPPGCSAPMYQLLQACWDEDPERRPSFSDLIEIFEKAMQLTQEHDLLPDLGRDRCLQSSSEEPHSKESYPLMSHAPPCCEPCTYIPPEKHRTLNPGVEVTAV